jgi:(4S)-4-hydroxy-5-phosphonooxypentane-2,3-dione isomerase
MYGILFRAEAKPGKYQELIEHAEWTVEVCNKEEPGTWRFDFYPDPDNDQAIYVYEAYRDREAFEAHKQNAPFQRWAAERRESLVADFKTLFNGDALVTMAE